MLKSQLNLMLGVAVKSACGFVKNDNGGIFQESPCNGDALPLSPRQKPPPFSHCGIKSVRQSAKHISKRGSFGSCINVVRHRIRMPICSVLPNSGIKEKNFLRNNGYLISQAFQRAVSEINSIYPHTALGYFHKTREQIHSGGFT